MATITKDVLIDANPADVWDALADFGALHQRLVPGFVTACQFDGEARTITFANGTVARELLVTSDSDHRRLVYAVVSERVKIGIGGSLSAPPLPHHRTYGSVYGGSRD